MWKKDLNMAQIVCLNFNRTWILQLWRNSKRIGSQCLVISIDAKLENNVYRILYNNGTKKSKYSLEEWINLMQKNGAGEILINSIDKDGTKTGYDINLLKKVEKISKFQL